MRHCHSFAVVALSGLCLLAQPHAGAQQLGTGVAPSDPALRAIWQKEHDQAERERELKEKRRQEAERHKEASEQAGKDAADQEQAQKGSDSGNDDPQTKDLSDEANGEKQNEKHKQDATETQMSQEQLLRLGIKQQGPTDPLLHALWQKEHDQAERERELKEKRRQEAERHKADSEQAGKDAAGQEQAQKGSDSGNDDGQSKDVSADDQLAKEKQLDEIKRKKEQQRELIERAKLQDKPRVPQQTPSFAATAPVDTGNAAGATGPVHGHLLNPCAGVSGANPCNPVGGKDTAHAGGRVPALASPGLLDSDGGFGRLGPAATGAPVSGGGSPMLRIR